MTFASLKLRSLREKRVCESGGRVEVCFREEGREFLLRFPFMKTESSLALQIAHMLLSPAAAPPQNLHANASVRPSVRRRPTSGERNPNTWLVLQRASPRLSDDSTVAATNICRLLPAKSQLSFTRGSHTLLTTLHLNEPNKGIGGGSEKSRLKRT